VVRTRAVEVDIAFDGTTGTHWLVWGSDGEDLIRADGATRPRHGNPAMLVECETPDSPPGPWRTSGTPERRLDDRGRGYPATRVHRGSAS
jgi:hypothetical protein